jgi:hypothetical protein
MAAVTTHIHWLTIDATQLSPTFATRRGVAAAYRDANVAALATRRPPS